MATENFLSGQKRIQVEPARLGVTVSARTIAKYMRGIHRGKPSPGWRNFLGSHAREIWACDFFCVRTIFFRTIYVFFIIHYASREVVHVRTTRHPTSEWTGQQIIEACGWHVSHRAFSCMTATDLHRRVRNLGITSIRTPFRSPQANAIAERWLRSVRNDCLDHLLILNERHAMRPGASIAPLGPAGPPRRSRDP